MALSVQDSHFQTEGNLNPVGPINFISGQHIWAFPTDDDERVFQELNHYTDTAQDFDVFTY